MNIHFKIKELEQSIEVERTELDRMIQTLSAQNKKLCEDMSLINRSQKLDAMVNELYRLKETLPPE